MKYKEWLKLWLKNYVKPMVKARTCEIYRQIAQKRLMTTIGNYEIDDLSPVVLQTFVTKLWNKGNVLTGKGLSASTVNLIVTIVQNSLKTAFALGYAKEYSANKIKRPKLKQKNVFCFSVAEQKKIEQAVAEDKHGEMFGIVLCLYTGLRIGELLALTWSDIDLSKGLLFVNKTCRDGKKGSSGHIVDEPKTESSKRTVPIPKQLICSLKALKKSSKSKYVISFKGKPISIRGYQRKFATMLERIGIPHKGFHSLRHTFATRALECGMDVKTLSELLGHKNATITLNRYAHSFLAHKANMMNKLGRMFSL